MALRTATTKEAFSALVDPHATLWGLKRLPPSGTGRKQQVPIEATTGTGYLSTIWPSDGKTASDRENAMTSGPVAALSVAAASRKTMYPKPFAMQVEGRVKRRLGDHFSLTKFGVNLTELAPGSVSALFHHHTEQDEFIFVVSGNPILMLGDQEYELHAGDCCGFKAGSGVGHQLLNKSAQAVFYLEIGDRTPGDYAFYPKDDLAFGKAVDGSWILTHKDGRPY